MSSASVLVLNGDWARPLPRTAPRPAPGQPPSADPEAPTLAQRLEQSQQFQGRLEFGASLQSDLLCERTPRKAVAALVLAGLLCVLAGLASMWHPSGTLALILALLVPTGLVLYAIEQTLRIDAVVPVWRNEVSRQWARRVLAKNAAGARYLRAQRAAGVVLVQRHLHRAHALDRPRSSEQ